MGMVILACSTVVQKAALPSMTRVRVAVVLTNV